MTDITEMALLVSKAKASLFTLEYISQFEPADIDADDVDLRFEADGRDTGTNVSIVDECGQAAEIIRALIDALETKDARIAECERVLAGIPQEAIDGGWTAQRLSCYAQGLERKLIELQSRAEAAEQHAVELVSSLRPVGVMSQSAYNRLENRESRFIALWPRPEIYLPRKRPDDGVIVYARTSTDIQIQGGE